MNLEQKIKINEDVDSGDKIAGVVTATVIVLVVVIGAIYYLITNDVQKEPNLTPEELLVQQQKQELEQLRQEANVQPLTQEQVEDQKAELDTLRQESGAKIFTEKDTEDQKLQLDDLRKLMTP